jgi:hypothetical protein
MRFMRYVFKQKTIQEICDMPRLLGEFTVMGFWRLERTKRDPSRDATGPLQEIKRELKRHRQRGVQDSVEYKGCCASTRQSRCRCCIDFII